MKCAIACALLVPIALLCSAQQQQQPQPAAKPPRYLGPPVKKPADEQTTTTPQYEVYAIRYGTLAQFPVAGLVAGADRERKLDIAMMVWLIRGGGRNILFDAGFYRDKFITQWKPRDFVKPSEALARVGLKPEDITDVVISHMHWDHADGADLFPKANVWLQKDEYQYYTGEAWIPDDHLAPGDLAQATSTRAGRPASTQNSQRAPNKHGGIDPDDVLAIVRINTEGRLRLVNGDDQEILPGIRAYTGGKHTWQSQYISVPTRSGTVVLASDNAYLYENFEKHAPIAQTLDAQSNLRAQDRMRQLASKPELIVPGHDPAVMERFPKVAEGVVRID